jgi:hypothetical protein
MNRTMAVTDKINIEIRRNQIEAHDWELHAKIIELDWWCNAFNAALFRGQPVPVPVLTFESARVNTLGHYRIGRNDFGVREQINLNRKHINRPMWDILATLLHEMVHSWEYAYLPEGQRTNNWYHKKGFRQKLASFGIETNDKGQHVRVGGEFVYLLHRHAVPFAVDIRELLKAFKEGVSIDPGERKKKGSSKLKKWSCGCTNVRVAVEDFQATCRKCGNDFQLQA